MAKGWRRRFRRGPFSWLGRIEGVEKPAILVGLGLVLYRAWRMSDLDRPSTSRWRSALRDLRQRLTRGFGKGSDVKGADGNGDARPPDSDQMRA